MEGKQKQNKAKLCFAIGTVQKIQYLTMRIHRKEKEKMINKL